MSGRDDAVRKIKDYFEGDEYKRNHILRALHDIADRLNNLDRLGYEPMEADFKSCPASSIPFCHTGVQDRPDLGTFTVYWKTGENGLPPGWAVKHSLSDQV